MSFLSNIFGKNKAKIRLLAGLGKFTYCDDGTDEYWGIEQPVSRLPTKFDFGAISGSLEGPNPEALEAFRFYAQNPETLYSFLNELFYSKLKEKFGDLTVEDVPNRFLPKVPYLHIQSRIRVWLSLNKERYIRRTILQGWFDN